MALVRKARPHCASAAARSCATFGPRLLPSVVEAIGGTPLVELSRFCAASGLTHGGRILAKLENCNPGMSKKDRIARQIVEDARADGELTPGQPVVELTSGNTGTGLAICCGVLGHPFVAVISRGNSAERARMMQALGAEVVLVDQCPDSVPGQVSGADLEAVEVVAARIVTERGAFRADQFHKAGSFRAHYFATAPEAWSQAMSSARMSSRHDYPIDGFVDFVGSGGTFAGVAAFLKEKTGGAALCWVVEPSGAPVLAGGEVTKQGHRIQGGGYSRGWSELSLMRKNDVDGYIVVDDADAIDCARRLATEEGIFGGFSSGANAHAALQMLKSEEGRGRTVLMTVCDSGLKYLSTDLWPDSE